MENILKYSVLRYSPSRISGEAINLGVLYFDTISASGVFKYIRKFSRLSSFDDEVDIHMVKALLSGIKEDIEDTHATFDIDEYVKYFINDFCFDKPKYIRYTNLQQQIEDLNKLYLRFEYDKSQRPSKTDDKKLIGKIMEDSGYHVERDKRVTGKFNESIKYDLVTDQYNIKFFDFDDKDLSRMINSAKIWAWNSDNLVDKKQAIIYRYAEENSKYSDEFNIIKSILCHSKSGFYDIDSNIPIFKKIDS